MVKLTVRSPPGGGPAPEIPARVQNLLDAAATDAAVELFAAHRVTIVRAPTPETHAPMADLAALGIAVSAATIVVVAAAQEPKDLRAPWWPAITDTVVLDPSAELQDGGRIVEAKQE